MHLLLFTPHMRLHRAQVAEQQGRYLAAVLNDEARNLHPSGNSSAASPAGSPAGSGQLQPFKYRHLGSMATVGGLSAVLQLGDSGGGASGTLRVGPKRLNIAGFVSWVAWRSAYLTRLGTFRARLQVAFDWSVTML